MADDSVQKAAKQIEGKLEAGTGFGANRPATNRLVEAAQEGDIEGVRTIATQLTKDKGFNADERADVDNLRHQANRSGIKR